VTNGHHRGFDSAGAWVVPERQTILPYEAAFVLQVRESEVASIVGDTALTPDSTAEVSIYAVADAFDRRSRDGLITPLGRLVWEAVAWGCTKIHRGAPDELAPSSLQAAIASRRMTRRIPRALDDLRSAPDAQAAVVPRSQMSATTAPGR
jgi:hypothetical protein